MPQTSEEFPSRRDGTPTEFSEYERFRGPPDGSDNTCDIQVGMERRAKVVPRSLAEVLMENKVARAYLHRTDFERWASVKGALGADN